MKPESHAWRALNEHAAAQLRTGFAERTLRAARTLAPSLASQICLSAATAAVCLAAVFVVHSRSTTRETERNLAGWEAIAAEAERLSQL